MQFVGELTSGIVHEINNPLTGIMMSAESLNFIIEDAKDNVDNLNVKDLFESVENTANSINKMCKEIGDTINSLSAFSKNSNQESFELIRLISVVDQSAAVCQNLFKKNHVSFVNKIKIESAKSKLKVSINPSYLSQAVSCCLKNSVEALAPFALKEITTWVDFCNDSLIKVYIQDSGTRPSDDIIEKMFEPFFTTKKENGLGLGLSVVKNVFDKYSCKIEVDKTYENTTLCLSLNLKNE